MLYLSVCLGGPDLVQSSCGPILGQAGGCNRLGFAAAVLNMLLGLAITAITLTLTCVRARARTHTHTYNRSFRYHAMLI